MTQDETYRWVRSQFGRTAHAYVESVGHAQGAELSEMVALAGTLHPGAFAQKSVLDVATGGGHTALAFAGAGAQVTATDLTPEWWRWPAPSFTLTGGRASALPLRLRKICPSRAPASI